MESEDNDRKLTRKQNLSTKCFDTNIADENHRHKKHQKHEIKSKKEELDQEEWEYWKNYYK